jgi:hypothetical protein
VAVMAVWMQEQSILLVDLRLPYRKASALPLVALGPLPGLSVGLRLAV